MTGDELPEIRYGTIDAEYARHLQTLPPDEDGPVWMVNLMRYRERADYADGRATTLTGREADDRYAPLGPLAEVGAEIVLVAEVEAQLLGAQPAWDRVAVVRYPTRRSFMTMQDLPDFQALHEHKDAGMAATIIAAGLPIPAPSPPVGAPSWTEVPHPPTDADGPVVVLHLCQFDQAQGGRDTMDQYTSGAARVAVPHGVRIAGWFGVEGTVVGDGRRWDEARFNAFPSRAAFEAVVFDPERLAHQREHREVALADTYTMILRPVIDRLHQSVTGEPLPT